MQLVLSQPPPQLLLAARVAVPLWDAAAAVPAPRPSIDPLQRLPSLFGTQLQPFVPPPPPPPPPPHLPKWQTREKATVSWLSEFASPNAMPEICRNDGNPYKDYVTQVVTAAAKSFIGSILHREQAWKDLPAVGRTLSPSLHTSQSLLLLKAEESHVRGTCLASCGQHPRLVPPRQATTCHEETFEVRQD